MIVLAGIALPLTVFAADIKMLSNIITVAFMITAACLVVGTVIVGGMFLTAGGEPEKLNKAKKALVWLIIGGGIYFGVYKIRDMVGGLFG